GANFGVFRYLQNYGKQNNVGVMLTHKLDEANAERGFLERNNTTLTVDGLIRPNDSWTVTYLLSGSRDNSSEKMGLAGHFFAGYQPQNAYMGWVTKFVDEKYVPGMGFVFANNTIHHNPGGYFIWRPKGKLGKIFRRIDPGGFINYYQNANDFKMQEASVVVFPIYLVFNSNAEFEYAITPTWQTYNFALDILGKDIPIGNYNVVRHLLRYESDASRKLSFASRYEFGGYFNGNLNTLTLSGRFAPIPNIALTANYEHSDFKNFGEKREDFTTDLYTVGLRVAPNPRIQLSGFYQYNTFDSRGRWNIRGSRKPQSKSIIYQQT
ncbi:MAG: hypothetical protein MUF45_17150, partial [Spirosomaceae bacterium]|nr:hypothetical protein [Spirosomataceae bacterium]